MEISPSTTPLIRRRRTTVGPDGKEDGPRIMTGMKCPESVRGYSNLDEILSSFGNWHKFYRRNVVVSAIIYLACATSVSIIYTIRGILVVPVAPWNSYCCCSDNRHALHQEAISQKIPFLTDRENVDDEKMFSASCQWGYLAGLALLFLCNRVGRRVTLAVSLVLFTLSIGSVYFVTQKSIYQTRMVVFAANVFMTQIDLTLMMHTLEWLPSAARPLGAFYQYACFHYADVLGITAIRYSHSFAPCLFVVMAGIVLFSALLLLLLRESPFYYLMKHDIDGLHDTLLYTAQYTGENSTELEQDVDDAVDDVAFEVYEGNDTVVDAMIRMFKQRKLVVTMVVMVVIITIHKEIDEAIKTNSLGSNEWGPFETPIRSALINVAGLFIGFLITRKRRALPITLSAAVTGLLLVIAYPIQGDDTYETCRERFDMIGTAGHFHFWLRIVAESVNKSADIAITVYMHEYFPSAVRPACIAIVFLATSSLQHVFTAVTKAAENHGAALADLTPIVYCLIVSLASLLLHKEPFPMTAWYVDLDRLDTKVSRESYPKPLLSRKTKKKTEAVDSDQ